MSIYKAEKLYSNPIIWSLFTFGLIVFAFKSRKVWTGPLSKIPGPAYARWTNLWLKMHVLRGRRLHYVHRLHEIYGPVVLISPTEIAISDLEATKTIHRVNSSFLKSPWYNSLNKSEHPGIFAMIDKLVRQKTDLTVRQIKREAKETGKADILKWLTFMATDVIGELSFGDSFRMLEQGKKNDYIKDVETALILSGIRAELPGLIGLLSLLPISSLRKIQNVNTNVAQYGVESVSRHRRMALTNELGDKPTFFSKIFATEKSQALTNAEIEQEASNLIVAGSDTTAVTLTYLIWAVLRHPLIHSRLFAELQNLSLPLHNKDLTHCVYFNAVINETLRLYGAAPGGLPRTVPAGGRTLAGYYVPEGATVTTQAYSLHRDAEIFSNPDEFWPERWLEPTTRMEEAFMPFGIGSRACIGRHLARLELSLAAATFFLECCNARVNEETTYEDMEEENYFLIAPKAHQCFISV